jgi:hypothetical protein
MVATTPSTTFTGTLTNSAGGQESFWLTKQRDGSVTEERIERNIYVVPPMGTYRLRLLRFAKPFELPKAEQYGGGTQTMTRLELMVVGGQGHGKLVTPMVSLSLGERSKLGQVARAAIKRDLGAGEAFDLFSVCHYWDQETDSHDFMATLKPGNSLDENGKPKHCNIVDGTIAKIDDAADGWVS